jgi:hypothetical protein
MSVSALNCQTSGVLKLSTISDYRHSNVQSGVLAGPGSFDTQLYSQANIITRNTAH